MPSRKLNQRFLVIQLSFDLVPRVVVQRMLEKPVGQNRFSGLAQLQRAMRNFPCGIVCAQDRESELSYEE